MVVVEVVVVVVGVVVVVVVVVVAYSSIHCIISSTLSSGSLVQIPVGAQLKIVTGMCGRSSKIYNCEVS